MLSLFYQLVRPSHFLYFSPKHEENMSEVIIKNDLLTAIINTKGAELCSLKDSKTEYIWQADAQYWGRHAPILFPIVGKLINDQYTYKGKTYKLPQHGFARDMEFDTTLTDESLAVFVLSSTEDTKANYPFDFELKVTYKLQDDLLKVQYMIQNVGAEDMFFSIGAHPAFRCPVEEGHKRSDYQLKFDWKVTTNSSILKNGAISNETSNPFLDEGVIRIDDDLFDRDALIFQENEFSHATIFHEPSASYYLSIHFDSFPYLGIWSKSSESPFLCVEPWHGLADLEGHNGDLTKKKGIIKLPKEDIFVCGYAIETY